jgi:uncharacterized membrane protein
MEILSLLFGTVILRPYVFVFLAFYLAIAILNMGLARSLIFTVLAYSIAFLSEYSSTRTGFPYGFYSYIDTTRDQELWITNVPFMDSLSYAFLSYISFTVSLLFWSSLNKTGWDIRLQENLPVQSSVRVVLTGAFFFMMMDVIIDPIAFLGDRWFLGKIYTYQEEGEYFNIPLTNFAGWFLVGTTILSCFCWLNRKLEGKFPFTRRDIPYQALLGPGLYLGVLIFNLAVTFYIGEFLMGLCGTLIFFGICALLLYKIKNPDWLTDR